MKKETAEALREKAGTTAKQNFGLGSDTVVLSTPPPRRSPNAAAGETTAEPGNPPDRRTSLGLTAYEPRIAGTTRCRVAPAGGAVGEEAGAPLKSAPFHTASTLKSLEPGTEVLILISTPYWYGVETHDGRARMDSTRPVGAGAMRAGGPARC